MIHELITMNGYGFYVWTAFVFTILGFLTLYTIIKLQLIKEQKKFEIKFSNLALNKIRIAKKQKIYKEILAAKSFNKI